jgi:plasmid stabilization system protein ParE
MVPRKLDYTDEAIEDLKTIRRWLTQPGSGRAARGRLKAIGAAINRLREHPCVYPLGRHPGVRELPCDGGYRVLYEVRPDTGRDDNAGDVQVLRVFGPGQSRERL